MSLEIGIVLLVLGTLIWLFSFVPLIRSHRGIIYLVLFRTFAALLVFSGLSLMTVASTYTTNSNSTTIPNSTTTYAVNPGTSASLDALNIGYVVVIMASMLIDVVWLLRDKRG